MNQKTIKFSPVVFACILVFAFSLTPRIALPVYIPNRTVDIRAEDIVLFLFIIWMLFRIVKQRKIPGVFLKIPYRRQLFAYVVISTVAILMALLRYHATMAGGEVMRIGLYYLKEIEIFTLGLAVFFCVQSFSDVTKVYLSFVAAGLLNVLWGIYQVLSGQHGPFWSIPLPPEAFHYAKRGAHYFLTTIGEPGAFLCAMCFSFFSFLGYMGFFFGNQRDKTTRVFLLGFGILSTVAGILTLQKMAVVMFFLVMGMVVILSRAKAKNLFIVLFLLASLLAAAGISTSLRDRNDRVFHAAAYVSGITNVRMNSWARYVPYLYRNFSFGVGRGSLNMRLDGTDDGVLLGECHNGYLRLLLESGIFGFAAFMWLLFSVGKMCLRVFYHASYGVEKVMSGAAFCMLIAVCVAALVQDAFTSVLPNTFLWICLGIVAGIYRYEYCCNKNR